jgi:putative ABC transport system permease protein
MFFVTYLRRELRRRLRQATFIALGLALGVGLVVTVSAASAGVNKAEASALGSLYGVGTNVTVTGPPVITGRFGQVKVGGTTSFSPNANGAQVCRNGRCQEIPAGQSVQIVGPPYSAFASADVAAVARLHDVSVAAGGLLLSDSALTITRTSGQATGPKSPPPSPFYFSVDGVDTGHLALGPLSAGTIISGHSFTAAYADSHVAVVDSGYATSNNLKTGSKLTIDGVRFTVIGIVRQPQTGGSPDDIYIPLARAQALELANGTTAAGKVDMIYVAAASAADIPAVQRELVRLLPADTVTTAAGLASEVTGSVANAAKLANDLGRWLAILVLIAAFAVASLLTMSAVARRAAEFGTLKALGWRTRRIIAQALSESVAMGVVGAAAGVGLGFAGPAIITAVSPKLPATVPGSSGSFVQPSVPGGPTGELDPATAPHVVALAVHPSVSVNVIVLAVLLAVAGGLLAGAFGSWRIARLRPADALSQVA